MHISQLSNLKCLLFFAIMATILTVSTPTKAEDKVFTSAEFLTWKKNSQGFYIEASIGMAASITSQMDDTRKKQASCIDNWYYPKQSEKNDFIRSIMSKNSEFHPRAIIIGILEKQCGEF